MYFFIWGQGQQTYMGPFNAQAHKISLMLHTNTMTGALQLQYKFAILLWSNWTYFNIFRQTDA